MKYNTSAEASAWVEKAYNKLLVKLAAECRRIGERIPYIAMNGVYEADMSITDPYWWTNGFWAGMLWQMYHVTGDEIYKNSARAIGDKLAALLNGYTGLHHDMGFMFLHSYVADYRLTGNKSARVNGLHAASLLASRFNPNGRFIRAWNNDGSGEDKAGWIIIDCLMNIPLLYWASIEEKDLRFTGIAQAHADTTMDKLLRPDGSCNHIGQLNPTTGELLDAPGGQGYEAGSAWTRGQAWGIYGFALSYRYTKRMDYLNAAKRIAHYFIAGAAANDFNILVDFRAPAEPVIHDTTAAVCAACGLLEIAIHVGEYERMVYVNSAAKLLQIAETSFANWNPSVDGILNGGSVSYHFGEKESSIIFGDYFLTEGILRLTDKDFIIW